MHELNHFVIFDLNPASEYPVEVRLRLSGLLFTAIPSQEGDLSELADDEDAARLQKRRRLDRPPPAALEKCVATSLVVLTILTSCSYYNSNFYGRPVSDVMFHLAERLARANFNSVWCVSQSRT